MAHRALGVPDVVVVDAVRDGACVAVAVVRAGGGGLDVAVGVVFGGVEGGRAGYGGFGAVAVALEDLFCGDVRAVAEES